MDNLNSETLASAIVAYKAFGLNKDYALQCMQELAKRRSSGDTFLFEEFIEQELNKLEKPPQNNITNVFNMISSLKNDK